MTDPRPPSSLEVRLQFETLLANVSARLVKARPDEIDAEITATLQSLLDFFEADRCGLLAIDTDKQEVHVTHGARAPGLAVVPPELNLASLYPWVYRRLLDPVTSLDATSVIRLDDVPPEGREDLESWVAMGVKSAVNVPVQIGDRVRYLIVLHWTREERAGAGQLVPRLRLLGEILVTALEHSRATTQLRESQARLSLATASAGAGAWDVDINTGRIWATPEAKELYGFPPDQEVRLTEVLERVHPEDREQVRARLRNALSQRAGYSADYRLVLPDGSIRWVNARGRLHANDPEGQPDRLIGISLDVTDRKRADLQVKEQEARLAAAMDAVALGFYETQEGDRIVFLDDRMRGLLGVQPQEEGRTRDFWVEHLHPDDRARILELSRRVVDGGLDRTSAEYRYLHPGGATLWLSHVSHALERDRSGRATRLVGVIQDITERKEREGELRRALEEVQQLRDQLRDENLYLQQQVKGLQSSTHVIGQSPAIRLALEQAERVAATTSTVLLIGETGTGKERFASAIHDLSPRRERPMVRVNCAAIPTTLIESELFGREKGAYTGALSRQAGRFELAHGSTLFLDEIGDLPSEVQVKLLRVLQDKQIERLGSGRSIHVDVRIIAATNQDLEQAVRDGRFREDLYYRLNVFPILIPPLRERREDIPLLVAALVEELGTALNKRVDSISKASLDALMAHAWPGNVRELRNVLERAMILATGPVLHLEVAGAAAAATAPRASRNMQDVERDHILEVLRQTGWRIRGRNGAAAILGLKPTTLEYRMTRLRISRPGTHEPQL
jgi:PAS domain S-box-containing protein